MGKTNSPADDALARLQEARTEAEHARREQEECRYALTAQLLYVTTVVERFTRRRDHLLAAGEENPVEAGQAAGLAGTAERLRKSAEGTLQWLAEPLETASERARKAADLVVRIDAAAKKLEEAMHRLELARLEKANRERLADLERTSVARLQQLGQAKPGARSGNLVPPALAQSGLDTYVRDVTRLAYEAEALADLQLEGI